MVKSLLAAAVATDIHRDHPATVALERVDPPRRPPVDDVVRGEPVDKEDRLAFPAVEECDIDPVRGEVLDRHSRAP